MENQQLSRFITYPSVVDKSNNHTVILIDASAEQLIRLERFLKISTVDFDVYLYQGENYDLEWLNYVHKSADHVLINDDSQVKVTDAERYSTEPLDYFEQYELDNQSAEVL
jgi:hypothetical protein